jgi:hypothetical protein
VSYQEGEGAALGDKGWPGRRCDVLAKRGCRATTAATLGEGGATTIAILGEGWWALQPLHLPLSGGLAEVRKRRWVCVLVSG